MKKLVSYVLIAGALTFGNIAYVSAQEQEQTESVAAADSAAPVEAAQEVAAPVEEVAEAPVATDDRTFHQILKEKFIEGGWEFMSTVLICLILGLAISVERLFVLSMATTNTEKLLANIESALKSGGVEAAKEVCRNTKGPVASIFIQGLMRASEGIEMVEKSIVSYGSVQMAQLERGMVWLALFIGLAPMLGFLGTVIGMVGAFDAIAAAGDISPQIVAGGIKVALITTIGGLIVAIVLQILYNYFVNKIDGLVNQMEDASISLIDIISKHNIAKK
jgi:biopolymer transport protein ExbB